MNCPVCKNQSLQKSELEDNLQSLSCGQCGGHWVQAFNYWKWRDQLDVAEDSEMAVSKEELPVDDKGARICPECSRFVTKYQVGHDVEFSIDRCSHCGGTWFDKNEWEVLKSRNLHDDVHFMFSTAWQSRVRKQKLAEERESRYLSELGESDFSEVKRIKEWLASHPNRDRLFAYLLAGD